MFAKKIFFPLILTTLMATAVSAQTATQTVTTTGDRASLWQKYFGRKAQVQSVIPVDSPEPAETEVSRQESDTLQLSAAIVKNRLEGTWVANVSFTDGFVLKVLFTFMAGKDENEGTLIDTNEFLLTPNPIGAPDQGVWQRTSDRTFIATHLAFLFDVENGNAPAGTAKVRDSITMTDQNNFTGKQYVEIYDAGGKLVIAFQANMTATRLTAQAPPVF